MCALRKAIFGSVWGSAPLTSTMSHQILCHAGLSAALQQASLSLSGHHGPDNTSMSRCSAVSHCDACHRMWCEVPEHRCGLPDSVTELMHAQAPTICPCYGCVVRL